MTGGDGRRPLRTRWGDTRKVRELPLGASDSGVREEGLTYLPRTCTGSKPIPLESVPEKHRVSLPNVKKYLQRPEYTETHLNRPKVEFEDSLDGRSNPMEIEPPKTNNTPHRLLS